MCWCLVNVISIDMVVLCSVLVCKLSLSGLAGDVKERS